VKLKPEMTLDGKRKDLRKYRWSSYGGYISRGGRRSFLQVKEVLAYWGGDTAKGRRKYEDFVMEGIAGKILNPLERGEGHGIVGASEFIKKIRGQYIRSGMESREVPAVKKILAQVEPRRIIRVICETFEAKSEELLRKGYRGIARGVLMEMLYRYGGMNQREIGELMDVDYSAVSVGRTKFRTLQEEDKSLMKQVEIIKKQLTQG
jgi:hypothetical protein